MVNYYAVLDVDEHATPEQIKRSYHRLALRYHPDKAGPDGAVRFREVNTAYGVLSDPRKKEIYDRYGEAGLDALENPVAGGALDTFGSTAPMVIALVLLFLCSVMVLLFLAFLVSVVDGRLTRWTYVKVFAPLFVLDVFIGVPTLLLLPMFVAKSPLSLHVHCVLLAILCAVILTIVIPIAKDRNEAQAAAVTPHYLQWRVWLIPGYLFSVFTFIVVVLTTLPTAARMQKLKSMGLVRFAHYMPVGFVLSVLQASCIVVFFALVACRADGVITINYFIVIGLPIFVLLTLHLVNRFMGALFSRYISDVPPEVAAAAAAQEQSANGGEPNTNGPQPSPHGSSNPMSRAAERGDSANANTREEGANQQFSAESHAHSSGGGEAGASHQQPEAAPEHPKESNPYAGQHASVCAILVSMLASILVCGLLMASAAMVSVRLNYYYHYGRYTGVLSLAAACSPLFVIIGVVVLAVLIGGFLLCCCGFFGVVVDVPPEAEHGNQTEGDGEGTTEMHGNGRADAAHQGEAAGPGVPQQDPSTTGRPAAANGGTTPPTAARVSADAAGTTPPERQPDNERLSDVD
ncbi:dnaj chaperone-like protein [Novymonas esmeraldas]|uniref:Dnaj chaperone-like protein n=1 Tax=Novymonas esmeraldas TaxID=1808958 RepID=A0AAW0EMZ9_9TRYP